MKFEKIIWLQMAAVVLLLAVLMQGCAAKADSAPTSGPAAGAGGREESADAFLGDYERADDGSTLSISENGNGTFRVDVIIFRLCSLENGEGTLSGHVMDFYVMDPNGGALTGRILREPDNSLTIEIADSTWEYLPKGERLEGFIRR